MSLPAISDTKLFRENVHDALRGRMLKTLADWADAVDVSKDPEDKRKFIEYCTRVLGLETEKKVDPHAGLATVVINLGVGGMQLTASAPQQVPAADPNVIDLDDIFAQLKRSPAMAMALPINQDVLDGA